MAPPSSPYKWMPVRIPIGGGLFHRLNNLLPGFKTPPFQRQGAEGLPPRLNQVEVGGIGRLKHEFEARMRQTEQQHVSRPMHREIVQNGVDPFHLRSNPALYLFKKRNPNVDIQRVLSETSVLSLTGVILAVTPVLFMLLITRPAFSA